MRQISGADISCLQESSSGRISYHESGSDGKPQAESQIDFLMEDVQKLRRSLRKGTLVEFSICTDNQTKAQKAVHVSAPHFLHPSQKRPLYFFYVPYLFPKHNLFPGNCKNTLGNCFFLRPLKQCPMCLSKASSKASSRKPPTNSPIFWLRSSSFRIIEKSISSLRNLRLKRQQQSPRVY